MFSRDTGTTVVSGAFKAILFVISVNATRKFFASTLSVVDEVVVGAGALISLSSFNENVVVAVEFLQWLPLLLRIQ